MDLKAFIEEVGDAKAGKLFGVSERTAQSWRLGERSPRPKQVPKIIKASGGRLSYESIYGRVLQQPAPTRKVASA